MDELEKFKSLVTFKHVKGNEYYVNSNTSLSAKGIETYFMELLGESQVVAGVSNEVMVIPFLKRLIFSKFIEIHPIQEKQIVTIRYNLYDIVDTLIISKGYIHGEKNIVVG